MGLCCSKVVDRVHHALNPDPYRGVFGSNGEKYARDVKDLITFGTSGHVAGFISEAIQGVGGIIELAPVMGFFFELPPHPLPSSSATLSQPTSLNHGGTDREGVLEAAQARRKQGRGRDLERVGIGTRRMLAWGSRLPEMPLKRTYIDKKCPFTGDVSIRGRILAGTCHSAIVRRNYLHFVKKYQRYEKRHSNIPAHISPCFRVKEGDHVTIGQCRPLSKTVRFNVLKVIPAGSSAGGKKAFTAM
ncbi:unnamed protein product [Camellia sinensis]